MITMSVSSFNYKGLDLLLVAFSSYILVVANRTRCLLQKIIVVEDDAEGQPHTNPNQSADGGLSRAVSETNQRTLLSDISPFPPPLPYLTLLSSSLFGALTPSAAFSSSSMAGLRRGCGGTRGANGT